MFTVSILTPKPNVPLSVFHLMLHFSISIVQLCFPTVPEPPHLPVGSYSEHGRLVVNQDLRGCGYQSRRHLTKDRTTSLDVADKVIPKDDFRGQYLDDVFNLLIAEQKANFVLCNN
jgi:hypothetical protein